MRTDFIKYLKQEVLITLVIIAVSQFTYRFVGQHFTVLFYLITALLFLLSNCAVIFYAYRLSMRNDMRHYSTVITASFLVKLMLTGILILGWRYFVSVEVAYLPLHYFLLYIIYTAHEVYCLTQFAQYRQR